MVEFFNDILSIQVDWLVESKIITYDSFAKAVQRGQLKKVRTGGNGRKALVEFDSMPSKYKDAVIEKLGKNPSEVQRYQFFRQYLVPAPDAISFFANYKLSNGRNLPTETAKEYVTNAMFLRSTLIISQETSAKRKALGIARTGVWESLSDIVNNLQPEYNHTLPANYRRLKEKAVIFQQEGYKSLISRKFCNSNSRKVDDMIERLLLSLACMDENPFFERVHEMYYEFVLGKILVFDYETGEVFDRSLFFKNEAPITFSESTVWNILRNPDNESIINKRRLSRSDYTMTQTPYVRRKSPQFSLSKFTMDDRTLPRKTSDDKWVNVYYAMDVASGCYISAVYSTERPSVKMICECLREMKRTLDSYSLPWGLEVEVENHLMSQIKVKLHTLFKFVRFCNPQNSREKRAEHLIRAKKYGTEKKTQKGIERWYGRGQYKKNEDIKQALSVEQIVAEDIETITTHNNSPHPVYKGKTRLQVLLSQANPEAVALPEHIFAYEVGYMRETTVRNKDSVRIQYADYWIDFDILKHLKPNNYTVQAYYIPASDGKIKEVHLFQDDNFLCTAPVIEAFQEALAEQTEHDKEIQLLQQKRVASRLSSIKTKINEVPKVRILQNTDFETEAKTDELIYVSDVIAPVADEYDQWTDYQLSEDFAKNNI